MTRLIKEQKTCINRFRFLGRSDETKRVAFTLAEVLITLGIIGVVAAMTLPSLINKAEDLQFKSAYKKAYSNASQALLRMNTEGEFIDISNVNVDSIGTSRTPAIGENFKIMSKYFKTSKTCFNSNSKDCWVCDEGEAGYMGGGAPHWKGCTMASYAFVDISGVAWYLYSNLENGIVVDVNGNKKPNQLGKDRHLLRFYDGADNIYSNNVDRILPHKDMTWKERWCPSGNCLYRSWLLK